MWVMLIRIFLTMTTILFRFPTCFFPFCNCRNLFILIYWDLWHIIPTFPTFPTEIINPIEKKHIFSSPPFSVFLIYIINFVGNVGIVGSGVDITTYTGLFLSRNF